MLHRIIYKLYSHLPHICCETWPRTVCHSNKHTVDRFYDGVDAAAFVAAAGRLDDDGHTLTVTLMMMHSTLLIELSLNLA